MSIHKGTSPLGEQLKQLRKRDNLTLDELAKKMDSTKSYMWELENNPNIRPSKELIYNFVGVLNEVALKKSMDDIVEKDRVFAAGINTSNLKRKTALPGLWIS